MINNEYDNNRKIFLELVDKRYIDNTTISLDIKETINNDDLIETEWNISLSHKALGELYIKGLSNDDVIDMIEDITGEDYDIYNTIDIQRTTSVYKAVDTFKEQHDYLINKIETGNGITDYFIITINKEECDNGCTVNLFDGINSRKYEPVLINNIATKSIVDVIKLILMKVK